MEINNVIATGRSGSNKAVVRLNRCGIWQFRRIVVLLGHKAIGISLTAINVTTEARTKSLGSLCKIIVKSCSEYFVLIKSSFHQHFDVIYHHGLYNSPIRNHTDNIFVST
jgi:hypothetical protein